MEIILAPYLISATLTPTKVIVGIAAIAVVLLVIGFVISRRRSA